MDVIIAMICGFFVGYIFVKVSTPDRLAGTIMILKNKEDPDNPYMFVELNQGIIDIVNEEFVTFEVNSKDLRSQK